MPNLCLSVILPVRNAEQTLARRISQLLEILPDLTPRFEVLIINDGSTDLTEEIAHDLTVTYPQIRQTRHVTARGRQGVIETSLQHTTGEILLIHDENALIDSSKLHRLWALRDHEQLMGAGALPMKSPAARLAAWGIRLEETNALGQSTGIQMIRRQTEASGSDHGVPRPFSRRDTRIPAGLRAPTLSGPRFDKSSQFR